MNTPYVALVSPSAKVRLIASDMFIDSGSIWAPRYLITLLMPTFEYLDNQVSGVNRDHYFSKIPALDGKACFKSWILLCSDLLKLIARLLTRYRIVGVECCENLIGMIIGERNGFTVFVSCTYCSILSTRSMSVLDYCDACCQHRLSCGPIRPDSNVCDSYIVYVYWPRARWCNDSHRYPHRRSVLNRLTFYCIRQTPLFMLGILRSSERLERLALMLSLPSAFLIWGWVSD